MQRCKKATELLELYVAALGAFHRAEALPFRGRSVRDVRDPVFAVLREARRLYWDHVMEHGCRNADGVRVAVPDAE